MPAVTVAGSASACADAAGFGTGVSTLGSLGSNGLDAVGLAFDGCNLLQGWHYGSRIEDICRKCMDLDAMGIRLDALSTIREQKRDEVFEIMSSLDNLMVVSTLMLSIGFGFVVDGTFPPRKAERLADWPLLNVDPLVVYSFLAALSLVFPFWSLVFGVRMRYELEHELATHIKEFKKQLFNVLDEKRVEAPRDLVLGEKEASFDAESPEDQIQSHRTQDHPLRDAAPRGLVWRVMGALRCPSRAYRQASTVWKANVADPAAKVADTVRKNLTPVRIERFELEKADIRKWAERDLQKRLPLYQFYIKLAQFFLWMGIFCSIFTSAILLGLYMRENFGDTPNMWMIYSLTVAANGVAGMIYVGKSIWNDGEEHRKHADDDKSAAGATSKSRIGRSTSTSSMSFPDLRRGLSLLDTSRSSDTLGGCSPGPSTPLQQWETNAPSGNVSMSVRVRERGVDHPPLQVRVPASPFGELSGPNNGRMDALFQNVRAKFQARAHRNASDIERPRGHLTLESLVLLRENLELVDDGDLGALKDDDELEAVFSVH